MYSNPAAAPPAPTGPRIGEWLSESFSLFGQQWQVWLSQGVLLTVIGLGPLVVIGSVMWVMMFGAAMSASNSSGPNESAIVGMLLGMMGFTGVVMLIAALVFPFLLGGMERTAAKQLRGEPISIGDLFSAGDVYLPLLGSSLITGIVGYLAGALLCGIGSYLVVAAVQFSQPLIVERRAGAMQSIQASWDAVRPHYWMLLLWIFLLALIGGLFPPVTFPIYVIGIMVAYRDMLGMAGALPPQVARPASPGPYAQVAGATYAPCPHCGRPVVAGAVMCPACGTQLPYSSPAGTYQPPPGPSYPPHPPGGPPPS